MTENVIASAERLDSWKAIADYLQRDVRTVRRWEKALALPVRRVPARSGHSVFAYVSEIETWLKTRASIEPASATTIPGPSDPPPGPFAAGGSIEPRATPGRRTIWGWSAAAVTIVVVVSGLPRVGRGFSSDSDTLAVSVTRGAVIASAPDGAERWRYAFPTTERVALPQWSNTPAWISNGHGRELLVATSNSVNASDEVVSSGQLLWLTPDGRLDRTLTLGDRLSFVNREYASPWTLLDARVDERYGTRRVAVAAHHYQWWPGLVTVLDVEGRRQGTFVNAGWVDRVHWLSPDRLIAAGFSNARDGGMVTLLDANALDGQSPVPDTSEFRCTSCAAAGPLRYVVFPRSEVNRASDSPFNRATLQPGDDRLLVRTVEMPGIDGANDAIYEFSLSLDLLRASYSDRYWEAHRALEAQGKIMHTRAECPDRNGPRHIDVWEPVTGWRTVTIAH